MELCLCQLLHFWKAMISKEYRFLPFCTNAGEGLGGSEDMIRELCPDSEMEEGLSIPDKSIDLEEKLSVWLSLK